MTLRELDQTIGLRFPDWKRIECAARLEHLGYADLAERVRGFAGYAGLGGEPHLDLGRDMYPDLGDPY